MATVELVDLSTKITYPEQGTLLVPPPPVLTISFGTKISGDVRYVCALSVELSGNRAGVYTEIDLGTGPEHFANATTPVMDSFSVAVPEIFRIDEPISTLLNITVKTLSIPADDYVYQITEEVAFPRYSYASSVNPKDSSFGYLKALCEFPNKDAIDVYVVWESSTDGIHNTPITHPTLSITPTWVKALPTLVETDDIKLDKPTDGWIAKPYYKMQAISSLDQTVLRPDVLPILVGDSNVTYSFRMVTLKTITQETLKEADGVTTHDVTMAEDIVLSYAQAPVLVGDVSEVVYNDFPISTSGKIFFKDSTTYSYGTPEHKNNIMGSNPGELTTPLSKILDLPAADARTVTAMCAWRNYLVSATSSEVFLTTKISGGYTSKTVSTFVGIPAVDGNCLKATANGIIFKSGNKVFTFYPNAYSSDESILRLTDISYPVESLIEEGSVESPPFALSTERAYWLFMPDSKTYTTKCLKYQYVERVWTYHKYPVLFKNYESYNTQELKLFGVYLDNGTLHMAEYSLDSEVSTEIVTDLVNGEIRYPHYGDTVHGSEDYALPIPFELDSGQKTDRVADFRQFVETKFTLATLNPKSNFPFTAKVHVDGCPFVTTLDVNSESPFWKTNDSHVGTVSTLFDAGLPGEDTYNTFRQGYLRYSGKGRTVRHILTGQSLYPFKIYEIDYRYRNLNVKK